MMVVRNINRPEWMMRSSPRSQPQSTRIPNVFSNQRPQTATTVGKYSLFPNSAVPNDRVGYPPLHSVSSVKSQGSRSRPTSAIVGSPHKLTGVKSEKRFHLRGQYNEEFAEHLSDHYRDASGSPSTGHLKDIHKYIPSKIDQEKERLYEDTLHLKSNINLIRDENIKLRTRNQQLDRENMRLTKAIEELTNQGSLGLYPRPTKDNGLTVALKKQVRELKEALDAKNEELEVIKKNAKYTKYQEIEMELKVFTDENLRLKGLLEEAKRKAYEQKKVDTDFVDEDEEEFEKENLQDIIDELKRENQRLAAELKYLEDQNYNFQIQRDLDQKAIQKSSSELARLKKILKEKDNELQRLIREGYPSNTRHQEKLMKEIEDEYKKKLAEEINHAAEKERQFDEMSKKLHERLTEELHQKQNLLYENSKLKETITNMEAKVRTLLNTSQEERKPQTIVERTFDQLDEIPPELRELQQKENENKVRKLKKVEYYHIKSLAQELSLRLRSKHVPIEVAEKRLFSKGHSNKKEINITELMAALVEEPFCIKDDASALLLARYMVEDNDKDHLLLDMHRSISRPIVRSIFKKIVGDYKVLDMKTEITLASELAEVFHQYHEPLANQFHSLPATKDGILSLEILLETLVNFEIFLTQEQIEYLTLRLFENFPNLKRITFDKIFEIFPEDENQRDKLIHDSHQQPTYTLNEALSDQLSDAQISPRNTIEGDRTPGIPGRKSYEKGFPSLTENKQETEHSFHESQ